MPGSFALFEELTLQTLKTVKKAGLPYFLFSEKEQFGASFGERFTNAIEAVFNKGYRNVITLGNDTPHLTKVHIQKAQRALEEKKLALGPSADGGFYLLGLSKDQFRPEEFKRLSWQTSKIADEISDLLSFGGASILRLQALFDLDNTDDLNRFYKRFKRLSKKLLGIIQKLFTTRTLVESTQLLVSTNPFFSLEYNKGSPLLLVS